QMIVALDKIKGALEEVGSSMDNIVKTVIYLKHLEDYQIMRDTESEYYEKHAPGLIEDPPASTFMQPASLSKPSMLIEIDVIATT
ncbi:RidA family protein, partial [Chloroflexota bacterium]